MEYLTNLCVELLDSGWWVEYGPTCGCLETVPHGRKVLVHQSRRPLSGGQRLDSSSAKRWRCHISSNIRRKTHRLEWFAGTRGCRVTGWYDPAIWPLRLAGEWRFLNCNILDRQSRPKRRNWCLAQLRPCETVFLNRKIGRECHHRLWLVWTLAEHLIPPGADRKQYHKVSEGTRKTSNEETRF